MIDDKKPQPVATENTDADITPQERALLDESMRNSESVDNTNLKNAALDNTDADGTPLNEDSTGLTGEDLDIPGADLDDTDEAIGEEDEENNSYSPSDTE